MEMKLLAMEPVASYHQQKPKSRVTASVENTELNMSLWS